MGLRPLRIFARYGREKVRVRVFRPLWGNWLGNGRRGKETTATRRKLRRSSAGEGANFFPVRRWLRKGRFLHTLSVEIRFCIRYRLRTGKKFVFGTRSRLRTGKKFTPPRRRAPEKKLCIFSVTDGEKVRFCTRYRLRTGKTTRSVGIFLALAFAGPRSAAVLPDRTPKICDGKGRQSNEKCFPRLKLFMFCQFAVHFFFRPFIHFSPGLFLPPKVSSTAPIPNDPTLEQHLAFQRSGKWVASAV